MLGRGRATSSVCTKACGPWKALKSRSSTKERQIREGIPVHSQRFQTCDFSIRAKGFSSYDH